MRMRMSMPGGARGERHDGGLPLRDDTAPGRSASGRAAARGRGGLASDLVLRKLKVDEPGDPLEREADDVAERVMRMSVSSPAAAAGCCSGFGGGGSCSESGGADVRRAAVSAPAAGTGGGPELMPETEARIRAGEAGGHPLPTGTRQFFEGRLGRDLSGVRVHTGPEAADLNEDLGAHAFTRGGHIWLGAGQRSEPSHVLAHELAHVIQQAGPATSRPGSAATPADTEVGDDVVHRFAPYWEPFDYNGTRVHNEVLPEISTQAGIFVEAPVPNADRLSPGHDKRGQADLYDASTTVGVYFAEHRVPRQLSRGGRMRRGGQRVFPVPAPRPSPSQTVRNVDLAPPSVTVGDLKPSHGTIEALEGTTQVRNYLMGFALAASEVNELGSVGSAAPPGHTWSPATALFSRGDLRGMLPDRYVYPASAQVPRQLVLKQNGRVIRPHVRAQGRLVLEPDPGNEGILNYIWVPEPGSASAISLPARVLSLGTQVVEQILNPLRRPPERDTVPRKAKVPAARRRPAGPRVQRSLRDSFDLAAWRTNRARISRELTALRGTSDIRDATTAHLLAEEHDAARAATGLPIPELPESTRRTDRAFDQVTFWTGRPAGAFGLLRRIFGRTFVRVAEAYERMRARFGRWLRGKRLGGGGGGLAGAAIKAVFSMLKMAGVVVLNRTLDVLRDSLVEGVTRKLTELVPDEATAALSERVEQVRELHDQLQAAATTTAESIVGAVFPGYQQELDRIERVVEIVGDITAFVNVVRWAARAVACLSPPAIGCLWALAQAVLEQAAAAVVGSCWFQRRIAPLVVGLRFLREDLPRAAARLIVSAIRRLLPEQVRDVFADDVIAAPPRADEIECDDSGGMGAPLSDEQLAVMELQERLGDERFQALLELMRARGVPGGVPLTRARCERIARVVEQGGLSAERIREFARDASGQTAEITELLATMSADPSRAPLAPDPAVTAPPPAGTGTSGPGRSDADAAGAPEIVEAVDDDDQPAEGGTDAAATRGDVQSAASRPSDETSGERVPNWRGRVARVRGRLVQGGTVYLDMQLIGDGPNCARIRNLTGLKTHVLEVMPSEADPGTRDVFLEVRQSQEFRFGSQTFFYLEGREIVLRSQPSPRP